MEAPNDQTRHSASPNSSEEIESLHGTPATKISPFSPLTEEQKGTRSRGSGIARTKVPPSFILDRSNTEFRTTTSAGVLALPTLSDPFTSAGNLTAGSRSSIASKLSPTALTFTPSARPDSASSLFLSASPSSTSFEANDGSSTLQSPDGARNQGELSPAQGPQITFSSLFPDGGKVEPSALSFTPSLRDSKTRYASKKPQGLIIYPQGIPSLKANLQHYTLDNKFQLTVGRGDAAFSVANGRSRALVFCKTPLNAPHAMFKELEGILGSMYLKVVDGLIQSNLDRTGEIYAKFRDIRDADQAYANVRQASAGWRVSFVDPKLYASKSSIQVPLASDLEGHILAIVMSHVSKPQLEPASLTEKVKDALQQFGEVMAIEPETRNHREITYRAEYFDAYAVQDALTNIKDWIFDSFNLTTSPYRTKAEVHLQQADMASTEADMVAQESGLNKAFEGMTISNHQDTFMPVTPRDQIYSPFHFPTLPSDSYTLTKRLSSQQTPSSASNYDYDISGRPVGRSPYLTPTHGRAYDSRLPSVLNPGIIGQERDISQSSKIHEDSQWQERGNSKLAGRQFRDPGHHNVVNVDRIRCGTDVRTTIMLRNIPNKIQYPELKEIVDLTCRGKYDFMYLRIDFANNCNVGYAFINFEDPLNIIDFFNDRAGRRWNCYNSDKVAEISYATIQGKDCLVQKFRNSSVMLEHPTFRPKIFHAGNHPRAGEEEEFPLPDNIMKMRRSIENAEHVGLFAPRVGQSYRDEQRRRRSQYDRGTRLAEIEDCCESSSYNSAYSYASTPSIFQAPATYGPVTHYSQHPRRQLL